MVAMETREDDARQVCSIQILSTYYRVAYGALYTIRVHVCSGRSSAEYHAPNTGYMYHAEKDAAILPAVANTVPRPVISIPEKRHLKRV